MRIDFVGNDSDFIFTGLLDPDTLKFDPDVVSTSTTRIALENPVTGWSFTFEGSNLPLDPENGALTGTVTRITVFDETGAEQVVLSGMSWTLSALAAALDAIEGDDYGPLDALLDLQPITYDSSAATAGNWDMYLDGSSRNNTLIGSAFSDEMQGGEGNDTLRPGANDDLPDWIVASGGNDVINFSGSTTGSAYSLVYYELPSGVALDIDLTANTGSVVKASGADTLVNLARPTLDGVTGQGVEFYGTDYADSYDIRLAEGSWVMVESGSGADSYDIDLAGGTLRLQLAHFYEAASGLQVNLVTGRIANDGFGNSETISVSGAGLLELIGTSYDDSFVGSDGDESFRPYGGSNSFVGNDGVDRVRYDIWLYDALEADLAVGTVTGFADDMAFTDRLSEIERLRGSYGDDSLSGTEGNDIFEGRTGGDTLNGLGGNDLLEGEDGNDLIYGGWGYDTLYAGAGNDTVFGGDGRDLVALGTGADTFNDTPQGGENGRDTVWGGDGNDAILGGNGDDQFFGEGHDDYILGRLGNDLIYGGWGYDTLYAGDGNDTVFGGDGRDLVALGTGADTFYDTPQGGENGRDTVFGGDGNDSILGGNGDDQFFGEGHDDYILGRLGNDLIYGGWGYDTIDGGAGNDTVFGGDGRDYVLLGDGDDLFYDTPQDGENGQDTVYAGAGNDTIEGGNGNDFFYGAGGDDLIFARLGNDTLAGAAGNDTLSGGDGSDRFVINAGDGIDLITDFTLEDQLVLNRGIWGAALTEAQVVDQFASLSDGDVVLSFSGVQSVTLSGLGTTAGLEDSLVFFG